MTGLSVVFCVEGMRHFGEVASRALGWPLFVDAPTGNVENVYIVGMYDPPYYDFTLRMTARAKKRYIHWCGSDVAMLMPDFLPEATHIAETRGLADELAESGITATVATFPTHVHLSMNPFPEKPAISFYAGKHAAFYGQGYIETIGETFPDSDLHVYHTGSLDAAGLQDLIDNTTVHVRLPLHDGSANSAREAMEAGRRVVMTGDLPFAKRVSRNDPVGVIRAIRRALDEKEPDADAAAYYRDFNSVERYRRDLEAVGL